MANEYQGWCFGNSTFFQDIYPGTRVSFFWIFCTSPGHVLHLYMWVACLSQKFSPQFVCAHPTDIKIDALEILHFPGTPWSDIKIDALELLDCPGPFTQTPGVFFGIFHFICTCLVDLKIDAPENSVFSPAIYMDSRVTVEYWTQPVPLG